MEEEKRDIIRIGEQDEIMEIIDKIKKVPERMVTLFVPENAAILQDITNLKILQKKAEEMDKEISISKSGAADSYKAELPKPQVLSAAAKTQESGASKAAAETKKVSDMVKKEGAVVDLRKMDAERQKKTPAAVAVRAAENVENPVLAGSSTIVPVLPLLETVQEKGNREGGYFAQLRSENEKVSGLFAEDSLLGEEKQNPENSGVRRINREDIFGEGNKADAAGEGKNKFDFSYGYSKNKKRKHSVLPAMSARVFASFILVCIFTAIVSLLFILPKADIAIALKQEEVKGDFSFVLDKNISEIDAGADKIPAKAEEISSAKTQTFSATSKKQLTTKASGEITIYNECSTGDQALVAGTRFLSKDGGKIFKVEGNVVVPGFTKPEDSVVPGSKTIKVTAEEAGEAWNVGATTFTIPKLQELASWKYSCLYAKSGKPMSGGSSKEVNYISQSDYDKAKETLAVAVKSENAAKVSQKQDGETVYADDKGNEGEITFKSSANVNDVADQFEMTATIKKTVLAMSKKDLETILAQKIKQQNSSQNAKPKEGSLAYEIGDIVEKDKQVSLNVSASQGFIFELDQDKIKKEIAGKNKQELNDYFTQMNGVKSVSVNLWPFWVSKVPDSSGKINISINSETGQ